MNTVTVKINGIEYNLRGKENQEYLINVAAYVDNKFKEIFANNNKLSLSSVAVLTAINIADEMFKYDNEIKELSKKKSLLEERHLALKERLREIKIEMDEYAKEKNSEVDNLKNLIFSLEEKARKSDELNLLLNEQKMENEKFVAELTRLQKENSKLKDDIKGFNELNANLQQALNNCREEISYRIPIDDFDLLKSKYDHLEKVNSKLNEENLEIQSNLKDAVDKVEALESKCNQLENANSEFQTAISEKEAIINEEKKKFEMLENEKNDEMNSLNSTVDIAKEELKKINAEKDALETTNKEIKFQLQNYKYRVLDLEKKLMDSQFKLVVEKRNKNPLVK